MIEKLASLTPRRIGTSLLLVTTVLLSVIPAPAQALESGRIGRIERLRLPEDALAFLKLTNETRARRGLSRLQIDRDRSPIARRHSREMAEAGELFHTTDVGPYLDGLEWHRWGENVGFTSGSAADLQDAFMGSEAHRHNILDPEFSRVAIGTARADGLMWVTLFFYG